MWKLTGDPQYRDWAWLIFRAFERWTKLEGMEQCQAADPLAAATEAIWEVSRSAAAAAAASMLSGHSADDSMHSVAGVLNGSLLQTGHLARYKNDEENREIVTELARYALFTAPSTSNKTSEPFCFDLYLYLCILPAVPFCHSWYLIIFVCCRAAAAAAAAATIDALEGHAPNAEDPNTAAHNDGLRHHANVRELFKGCTSESRGGGYTNLDSGQYLFAIFSKLSVKYICVYGTHITYMKIVLIVYDEYGCSDFYTCS